MKPSTRIKEIYDKLFLEKGIWVDIDLHSQAVVQYLDEQHEKNKPCEHTDSYQVDPQTGDVFYNVCNKCGVLFLAKKEE